VPLIAASARPASTQGLVLRSAQPAWPASSRARKRRRVPLIAASAWPASTRRLVLRSAPTALPASSWARKQRRVPLIAATAWPARTRGLELRSAPTVRPARTRRQEAQLASAALDMLRPTGRIAPLATKANSRPLSGLGRARCARKASSRTLLGLAIVRLVHLVPAPQLAPWIGLTVAVRLDKQDLMVGFARPALLARIRAVAARARARCARRVPRHQLEAQACKIAQR
jgi:hypothetical protein